MKQQDLVWVKLPFSNLQEEKLRPAIIVSNNNYNSVHNDVILCAITSKIEKKDYGIIIDDNNLSKGKIPLKSRIRADKIIQVEKTLVLEIFAQLNSETYDILIKEINRIIERK